VLVGDVTMDQAVREAERLLGAWPQREPPAPPALPLAPPRSRTIHVVDRPGAPQSELRIGLAGPPRNSADYFPLLVGNTVLGGAFTSRLNMCLREEKAYTYGAASRFAFRADGGPFLASTAVFTGATADAVNDIVREVARLGRERVSDSELERAQHYLVLGLPRTFETTVDIAEHVSEMVLYRLGRDFFDTFAARVHAVTSADVMKAAARWLEPDRLTIVIVGDAAVIGAELESLDLGPVEVTNVS
jgi:predicted Zn-dependent peptidase